MKTKKVPHLVQYQGSKRILAPKILKFFPTKINRLIEPFAGTAAMSIASAFNNFPNEIILNDVNTPLANLLRLVIEKPEYISNRYEEIWSEQKDDSINHYYEVRDKFNSTQDPILFLYLLARCVKGAVRYNSEGAFNQSPDKRRLGTRPKTMRKNILGISLLLKDKTTVFSKDYKEILDKAQKGDFVYMDPPYQGVCGERDSRYFSGIEHDEFVSEIEKLNKKEVDFIISYDGKLGKKSYGEILPENLDLEKIEVNAGRSAQSTLLGKEDITYESIYLSKKLIKTALIP